MKRIFVILMVFGLGSGLLTSKDTAESADRYPVKPVSFIVPIEAGSDGDLAARPLVEKASSAIGKPIMVVNKPGAGSTKGYWEIHDAKPDGYTIGMGTITLVTSKLQGLFPYDYHDFSLLGTFYRWSHIIVASTKTQRPFKTMEEALSFAKANPGIVSVATAAVGQAQWISAQAFQEVTGIKFNMIPQEGSGGFTIAQVAGGHTDLAVIGLGAAKSQIEAGNVRVLAVLGAKRNPGKYSYAPTLKELGYDISWETVGVVIGPPKIPKEPSDKLVKAFEVAAKDPEYKKFLEGRNANDFYLPPDQIVKYCDDQRNLVRKIMSRAGILKEK